MSDAARFHPDEVSIHLAEKPGHLATLQLTTAQNLPSLLRPVNPKHLLRYVQTYRRNLHRPPSLWRAYQLTSREAGPSIRSTSAVKLASSNALSASVPVRSRKP